MDQPFDTPSGSPDLRDYWRILVKRRWIVISIFLSLVTAGAIYTFTATPIYKATAQVLIEKSTFSGLSAIEMMLIDTSGPEFYKTQQKILESRTLAREVNKRLNLSDYPEFKKKESGIFHSLLTQFPRWFSGPNDAKTQRPNDPTTQGPTDPTTVLDDSSIVGAFKSHLKIELIPNSRLLNVNFESADPNLAPLVANTLVASYIDWNLALKVKSQQNVSLFLDEQVKESRRKLDASEQALQQYREKYGVAAISPQLSGRMSEGSQDISRQKLSQVNTQLVEATKTRIEAETSYKNTLEIARYQGRAESIPEVVNSPVIIALKAQEVQLLRERAEKSEKFGPKHHIMVTLNQDIENLKKKRSEEIRNIVNAMKNRYEVVLKQEQSLQRALGTSQGEAISRDKIAIQYQVLQQEVESNRSLYDMLLKRLKEVNVGEENRTVNIHAVDLAETPKGPARPRVQLNMLAAIFMGLILGGGMAFFIEYMDDTVKTPDDLKRYLNLPYLGPVPNFDIQGRNNNCPELVLMNDPKSQASEAYRAVRTGILFSTPDHSPRTLLITSVGAKEGKTLTSVNMAAAMAQAGQKVLMLDCDMRKPRIHKIFKNNNERGLSNILVGEGDWDKFILPTPIPNLEYIPSGPIPPNPSELLGADRMQGLIEEIKERYDRIIIDSSPVGAVTDPVILSRLVEGVILVIKVGKTSRDLLTNTLARLKDVQARILGAVLNDINVGRDGYYYYQYYYHSYYGDNGEKKKGKKASRPSDRKKGTMPQ